MDRTTVLTVTIPEKIKTRLDDLARETSRSEADLVAEALYAYFDGDDAEFVADVEQALREADAGEFLSDEELAARKARWLR